MEARIAVDPNIRFGKPRVVGTRITVLEVLELVASGLSFETITGEDYYPDLKIEDVRACVQYAMDVIAIEDIHLAIEAA